ncbi:MAG: hypothetical protein OXI60_02315 [Acidiferrobacterales bacterium]|nr:hypothetical protein [Acidiferrobacterales bacterium]
MADIADRTNQSELSALDSKIDRRNTSSEVFFRIVARGAGPKPDASDTWGIREQSAMNDCRHRNWQFHDSRGLKVDFHARPSASLDTSSWQSAKDKKNKLTQEKSKLKYMEPAFDCVAVSDRNTGEWIDKLKGTHEEPRQQAEETASSDRFRESALFSGVEYFVNGEFHFLGGFDSVNHACTFSDLLALSHGPTVPDHPEDNLDNHSTSDLIVHQIQECML